MSRMYISFSLRSSNNLGTSLQYCSKIGPMDAGLWMPPDSAQRGTKAQISTWSEVSPQLKGEVWNPKAWLVLEHSAEPTGSWQDQPWEPKCQVIRQKGSKGGSSCHLGWGQRKCGTGIDKSEFCPFGGPHPGLVYVKNHMLIGYGLPHFSLTEAMCEWMIPVSAL